MIRKKVNLILITLLVSLLLVNLSSAWIVPETHDYIAHEALNQASNSTGGQVVAENFDDFSACMSLTDYSVFFYFQQGFSTIGKVYLASHNNLICPRAIELADKNNPHELACAYGICGMEMMDSPSHNGFVPSQIERTGLVNGIVHAPSEECVNKKVTTQELKAEGRSALVNKYPVHKDYLIKVFQSDERAGSIDVGLMIDAFVAEVAQNDQYTVGFRGFTAIPTSIHIILILYFLLGTLMLAYLVRRKKKSLFNIISIFLILFLCIFLVITLYVLYFTGHIWQAFQIITTPYCWIAPISGWESYINEAVSNMVNLFNNGASVVYQIPDPSGLQALHNADSNNIWKLWIIGFILVAIMSLFIWLNVRKKT